MPGSEFMGTLVLVLPGNGVVANVALRAENLKTQLFRL
jgi:glycerol uptake facilitator-like aquaporin